MSNISTCNNLIVSGNQTISGNIISNANLQTNIITSTSINNTGTLSSLTINGTTANVTNVTLSNILTLLAATPIKFLYNGTQYNMSALMLYTLYQLNGVNIASQNYVQTQIASLINSSPALLDTLSELATAIGNDPNFSVTMTNLIATKSALSGNNIFTGQLNIFNNLTSTNLVCSSCSVNSTQLRSSSDIWEASINPTGSYLYFNNAGTIGIYNTNTYSSTWFIDINGLGSFPTITSNTANITTANINNSICNYSSITNATITNLSSPNINITDANIRNATISNSVITNSNISSLTLTREILVPNYIRTTAYDVSDSTPRINYLGAGADMTVNLNALGNVSQNCIFEFRITSSPAVTFRTTTTMAYILDLNNNVVTSIYANSKNYFRFHYVYNGTNYVYYQLS